MRLDPTDLKYLEKDARFKTLPEDMTFDECELWTQDMPPAPVFVSGQDYSSFVQRQTAYAQYRNAVTARLKSLVAEHKKLSLPSAPVGDDIKAAIDWIKETGPTPIEYLVKTYRNSALPDAVRITAAAKCMDYVHRKMPTDVKVDSKQQVTTKSLDPMKLATLTTKELDVLEALLSKMAT
jgi:hypothetical protein